MIDNYLKTGMVFYDDQDKQHFRSECCKEVFYHYTDASHFPSFQFITDVPIFSEGILIQLYDLNDVLIGTFADADFNAVNTIYIGTAGHTYVHNNVDIISYPAGVDYETGYYIKICFCIDEARFVFLANGTNGLDVYSVNAAGVFTHVDNDDQGGIARKVFYDGTFVYLANGLNGLEVYSISADGILTWLDNDNQGGTAYGVWGDGDFIYLANGARGIEVYSVSDAGILTHVDNDYILGSTAYGVWGDGDYIYLANGTNGLDVYSVDGVGTLTHEDNDDQGGFARSVWGDGDFIYLANSNRGIESYSVDGVGTLTWIDNDFIAGSGWDVWGDGNFVYLANGTNGVEVYSVSAGGLFTHEDNDDLGSTYYGVWGDGRYIYLANDANEIQSYSVDLAGMLTHIDNADTDLGQGLGVFVRASTCVDAADLITCWYSEAFKVCNCNVEGAGDGENMIENGWFEVWDGAADPNNLPIGWTVHNNNATNYVHDAGGECQMISDGLIGLYISQSAVTTIGKWYVATIDITARVSGGISFYSGGILVIWSTIGRKNLVFQAGATDVIIGNPGVVADITYTNLRVEEFVGFEFCDRMTLNWWSDCDWDRIIYQDGFRNSLVLVDPKKKELQIPAEDIVVNPTERLGELFAKDVIIKKRDRFKIRIPEYLWNALIRLPAYGSEMPNFHCWLTLPDGTAAPMSEVIVKGDWDTGNCFNTFEVEFIDNDEYPVVAGNCCKSILCECEEKDSLLLNGDFADWTGVAPNDTPDNWNILGADDPPTRGVTEVAGQARVYSTAACPVCTAIAQNILTVGKWYCVEFDLISVASGNCRIQETFEFDTPGHIHLSFLANDTWFAIMADNSDFIIDNVTVCEIA